MAGYKIKTQTLGICLYTSDRQTGKKIRETIQFNTQTFRHTHIQTHTLHGYKFKDHYNENIKILQKETEGYTRR